MDTKERFSERLDRFTPTQSSVSAPPRTESQMALVFWGRLGAGHSFPGSSRLPDPTGEHAEHWKSPELLNWAGPHAVQDDEPTAV